MRFVIVMLFICLIISCRTSHTASSHLPRWIKGAYTDDYGIEYTIDDTLIRQHGIALYHVVESNAPEQYLLVRNDSINVYGRGLYSRIDYMPFTGMEPYTWGYCLTVYQAPDMATARKATPADRSAPKTGCNGYPFSRMKKKG